MKDVTRELCFEKDDGYKKKMLKKYALYLANYVSDRKCVLVSPQAYWEAMGVTDKNEIGTLGRSLRNELYRVFKEGTNVMYEKYITDLRRTTVIPDENYEVRLEDNLTRILMGFSHNYKSICGGVIDIKYFKQIMSDYKDLRVYTLFHKTLNAPLSFAIFNYEAKTSTLELVLTCSVNIEPPEEKKRQRKKSYYLSVFTVKSAFVDLKKTLDVSRVVLTAASIKLVGYYETFYGFKKGYEDIDVDAEETQMYLDDFDVISTVEPLTTLKGAEVSVIPRDFTIHYVSACAQCAQKPSQVEVSGKMREFCGKPCQIKFYKL